MSVLCELFTHCGLLRITLSLGLLRMDGYKTRGKENRGNVTNVCKIERRTVRCDYLERVVNLTCRRQTLWCTHGDICDLRINNPSEEGIIFPNLVNLCSAYDDETHSRFALRHMMGRGPNCGHHSGSVYNGRRVCVTLAAV